jgi:hypothetical protein
MSIGAAEIGDGEPARMRERPPFAQAVGLRLAAPSAIASAKFAKSTVNQSQSAICSVKTASPRP